MIERVIETLTPPEAWIKGAFARNRNGNPIGPNEKPAMCWCVAGAVMRQPIEWRWRIVRYIDAAIYEVFPERWGGAPIPMFNDHPDTTHADVLRVLTRARELEMAAA